jgi:hypothetical protein
MGIKTISRLVNKSIIIIRRKSLTGALAMVPGEILNRQTIVMPLMWCASFNELRCAAHAMRDKPATTVAIRMMTPCTSLTPVTRTAVHAERLPAAELLPDLLHSRKCLPSI